LEWLRQEGLPPRSFVLTSMPDMGEARHPSGASLGLDAWRVWFADSLRALLKALPPGGAAVFVETDLRECASGQESKLMLALSAAADVEGVSLIWHKVVHFGTVDEPSHGSPKYSHLICFARVASGKEEELAGGLPDIFWRGLKPRGFKHAERCFGVNTVKMVLQWAKNKFDIDTVVDPFCGAGTVLAVANALGLHAVGLDVSPKAAKQAKALDGEALLVAEQEAVEAADRLKDPSTKASGKAADGRQGQAKSQAKQGVKLSSRALRKLRATGGVAPGGSAYPDSGGPSSDRTTVR